MKNRRGEVEPVDNFPRLAETATPDRCHRCQSMIWKAICRTGFETKMDPEPVDAAADLAAFLERRPTYRLWRTAAGFEIDYRLPRDIRNDDGSRLVLAAHRCDPANIREQLPDYWPKPTYANSEDIPF